MRCRVTFPIENLSCGGGGSLQAERVLVHVPGVVHASVNPVTEMAYVEYDLGCVDQEHLLKVVEQAGFRVGAPSLR